MNKNKKRLEVRRVINEGGNVFLEIMHNTNEELGNIAGEFMSLNEEYVLNYHNEEETNKTGDILRTGFTTNQKRFLERLRYRYLELMSSLYIVDDSSLFMRCNGCATPRKQGQGRNQKK